MKILSHNVLSNWIFILFVGNYIAPKTFTYNPFFLLIFAIIFFYGFVVALILFPPHNYKLAAIVAAGGMFSKVIPLYLLWLRQQQQHTTQNSDISLYELFRKSAPYDAAIVAAYFIFLSLQKISVFDVYRKLIAATYKARTMADFIPILFGIVPTAGQKKVRFKDDDN